MTDIVVRTTEQYTSRFDAARQEDEFGEWWSARELMNPYGYSRWDKFSTIIDRAKIACATSGQDLTSNFSPTSFVDRYRHRVPDYRLTRYAAYLVAMEGDPTKSQVADAKTYFAVQTRKAEVGIDSLRGPYRAMYEQLVQMQRLEDEQRRQAAVQDLLKQEVDDLRVDMDRREESMKSLAVRAEEAARSIAELGDRVGSVEAVTPLTDTTRLHSGKEAAQLLGYGQIRFFELLRELGVIYRDSQQGGHKIYQKYLDQGWGQAKWLEWSNGKGWSWTPFFTAKGISRIQKLIEDNQLPVG